MDMKKLLACLAMLCLLAMPAMAGNLSREVNSLEELQAQYAFTLDGVEYRMPVPLPDMHENGWGHTSPGGTTDIRTFEPNTYGVGKLYNGENYIEGSFCNATDRSLPVGECELVEISIDENTAFDFALGNGLAIGTDAKQVVEAFGLTEEEAAKLEGESFLRVVFDYGETSMKVVGSASPSENCIYIAFTQPFGEDGAAIKRIKLECFPG